jgi:hypothetical protein
VAKASEPLFNGMLSGRRLELRPPILFRRKHGGLAISTAIQEIHKTGSEAFFVIAGKGLIAIGLLHFAPGFIGKAFVARASLEFIGTGAKLVKQIVGPIANQSTAGRTTDQQDESTFGPFHIDLPTGAPPTPNTRWGLGRVSGFRMCGD